MNNIKTQSHIHNETKMRKIGHFFALKIDSG